MKKHIVIMLLAMPILAMADVAILPHLHESCPTVVFGVVVGIAGGAAVLSLLERRRFNRKINAAWPMIESAWQKRMAEKPCEFVQAKSKKDSLTNLTVFCNEMECILRENQEIGRQLAGIPFEWFCKKAVDRLASNL